MYFKRIYSSLNVELHVVYTAKYKKYNSMALLYTTVKITALHFFKYGQL